mgnify:FL=1
MAGGLFDCPDNLEILLGLGEKLRREGYRVSGVLSAPEGCLWGFHAYPRGFLDMREGAAVETLYLSHYIQYLIQKEKPDVFLAQVPGGALKYSERMNPPFLQHKQKRGSASELRFPQKWTHCPYGLCFSEHHS